MHPPSRSPCVALCLLASIAGACGEVGSPSGAPSGAAAGGGGQASSASDAAAGGGLPASSATSSTSDGGDGGQGTGGDVGGGSTSATVTGVGGEGGGEGGRGGDGGLGGAGGAGSGGFGGAGGGGQCPEPSATDTGLWVWNADVVTDLDAREALLSFAETHAIDRLFLHSATGPNLLVQNLMQESPDALASFLDAAAARCVEVELLFGEPTWALTDGHTDPIALAAQVVAFAATLPGARPVGIHLDVEAHGVHGAISEGTSWDWSNDGTNGTPNQQIEMVDQYLDLLDAVRDTLTGSPLQLSVDIPFWYDGIDAAFNPLVHGGVERLAAEHVIEGVDRTVLMDYRDSAFGAGDSAATSANGIYDLGAVEVAYASAQGRSVVLGVETIGCTTVGSDVVLDGSIPGSLSFCDEGVAVMTGELELVAEALAEEEGLAGFAVHHWGSYGDPARMAP